MSAVQSASQKEFAAILGVAPSTVRAWINRGKISGAALRSDGKIDVKRARRQLATRRDPTLGRPPAPRQQSAETSQPDDAPDPLHTLRLHREALEVEKRRIELNVIRRRYVAVDAIMAEHTKSKARIITAVENWLPQLIAGLGLGAAELAFARGEFRRLREREAAAARGEAAALPEFVDDANL